MVVETTALKRMLLSRRIAAIATYPLDTGTAPSIFEERVKELGFPRNATKYFSHGIEKTEKENPFHDSFDIFYSPLGGTIEKPNPRAELAIDYYPGNRRDRPWGKSPDMIRIETRQLGLTGNLQGIGMTLRPGGTQPSLMPRKVAQQFYDHLLETIEEELNLPMI